MTVTPITGELCRFFVSSESRSDVDHIVDMDWREEKWHRPRAKCGCEQVQAKGEATCKHIFAVVDYLSHEKATQTNT